MAPSDPAGDQFAVAGAEPTDAGVQSDPPGPGTPAGDPPEPDADAPDESSVTSRRADDAGRDDDGRDDDDRDDAAGSDGAAGGDGADRIGGVRRRRRAGEAVRPAPRKRRSAQHEAARPLHVAAPQLNLRAWVHTAGEGIRTLMARPLTSFHLVVFLTAMLTVLGLIMVWSASSVEGYAENQSSYGAFVTQTGFAVLGWFGFYLILRLPIRFFRRFATLGLVLSIVLLVLVLVPQFGVEVDGARRWFVVAGVSIQPSDLAKVALCVWGAHVLASRRAGVWWGRELLFPLVPVAVFMSVLIILEPNLSTTVILLIITAALLWFAGLPGTIFAGFTGFFALAGVIAAFSADYRAARVFSFLGSADPLDGGYQAMQAKYALANGGVFGVGLGQSTAKWSYLPNAHNDFIFAILVEETGLVGGMTVVGLFLLLGYVGMRIARRSVDPFLRLLTATITVLITAQMFINVGYVVGLLPVTGIQLPLLSQGGTSMLTMLVMLGMLASAARHEPDAVVALAGGRPGGLSRLLRLPPPAEYRPRVVDQARDRLERRRSAGRVPDARRDAHRAPATAAPGSGSARRGAARPTPPPRSATPRNGRRTMPPLTDRARAQRSDEIHYPARRTGDPRAGDTAPTDPRRPAPRGNAAAPDIRRAAPPGVSYPRAPRPRSPHLRSEYRHR